MKTMIRLFAVSALLTLLFAMPVMAKEVSISADNTDVFIAKIEANNAKLNADLAAFIKAQTGPNADAAIALQTAIVAAESAKINKECSENHIQCLTTKLANAKQLEATRLAQLNWFTSLTQMSPTWAPYAAMAQREYDFASAMSAISESNLASAKIRLAPYM